MLTFTPPCCHPLGCITMRCLWISCLLIGSITCTPLRRGYYSDNVPGARSYRQPPYPPFPNYGYMYSSGQGVSSAGGSSPFPQSAFNPYANQNTGLPAPPHFIPSAQPSSSGSMPVDHKYDGGYSEQSYNPGFRDRGFASAAFRVGGYGPSDQEGRASEGETHSGASAGSPGGDWTAYATGYGAGQVANEDLKPVFSDVSALTPSYTFNSRSRFQRGRAVFAQTRYTPGEPDHRNHQPVPLLRYGKNI